MSIVKLKNKQNDITYVYESTSYWDKEKKQARNRRKCIGKLDSDTGKIIYSKAYLELQQIQQTQNPGPVPTLHCKRSYYGAIYLFNLIGAKLGITEDLKACFPISYKQILSIAYYLILEDRNPLNRFPKWSRTHTHPYNKDIPSQRSSELFGSISEDAKQRFFRLMGKRRLEEEFLAYDTTSISSYSKSLKQVKYGLNKDHDPLPQINLALLFGEKSRLPVYYRKLPGNISDSKTIKKLLSDIDFLQIKKVKYVMDRGFYSCVNINSFYKNHFKFIIAAKTSLKFIKDKIEEVQDEFATRRYYSSKYELYYTSFKMNWDYSEEKKRSGEIIKDKRRIYLHIYYNDQRATDDKISFNKLLDSLEDELRTGNLNPKHDKLYSKYYDIKRTPVKGVTLKPKDKVIKAVEKKYGYFTLLSNCEKDPLKTLQIYRSKDVIEKAFGNLKERLNLRKTSVSSEENLDGKLFVQFIALIYLAFIKKVMNDNNLFKKYTTQELLDEFDVIERYEQPGKKHMIGEVTNKQKELYTLFGFKEPS